MAEGPNPPHTAGPAGLRGDIDGFFGLFVDNLLQLLVIAVLCPIVTGLSSAFVVSTILPGAAVSILVGNLWYARMARRLADTEGREDVTALPYGINTPSVFAFIFLVMGPVFSASGDPVLAWQVGLVACALSGLIELAGAWCGDWLRRNTPRAALLSALAGIAITFISMGFVFQLFASPLVAVVPMMIIVVTYASGVRLPLGAPAGLAAILAGAAIAWVLDLSGIRAFPDPAPVTAGLYLPLPVVGDIWSGLGATIVPYLSVIVPMGLFNVIGSLQNLDSAEAAGDRFETRPALLANGAGTLLAAGLGSPFPTTIYIGHPGWKAMGAGRRYSTWNGIAVFLLCLTGGISAVLHVIPMEAMLGILLWIGVVMTAQAFGQSPVRHGIAVAIGLIPALAGWALLLIETTLRAAGSNLAVVLDSFGGDLHIRGVIALSQGFLLSSLVIAAITAHSIDRRFRSAAGWAVAGAVLSLVGLIHAWQPTLYGIANLFGVWAAPEFAAAYGLTAVFLMVLALREPDGSGAVD